MLGNVIVCLLLVVVVVGETSLASPAATRLGSTSPPTSPQVVTTSCAKLFIAFLRAFRVSFPSARRDRLRHLHHRPLHRLLLQHHHGVGPVLPAGVLSAHAALDHLQQQLEHGQLQPLHVHRPQRVVVQLLHLPRRGVLYVSACKSVCRGREDDFQGSDYRVGSGVLDSSKSLFFWGLVFC